VLIGLVAGTVVGILAGWGLVLIRPSPSSAHNLGFMDDIVAVVSFAFVCISLGGLAGVFWPIKDNHGQPGQIVRLLVAFGISLPGDLVAVYFAWEAYQKVLIEHRRPDYKPSD
jgi:hypothetical protein